MFHILKQENIENDEGLEISNARVKERLFTQKYKFNFLRDFRVSDTIVYAKFRGLGILGNYFSLNTSREGSDQSKLCGEDVLAKIFADIIVIFTSDKFNSGELNGQIDWLELNIAATHGIELVFIIKLEGESITCVKIILEY